MPVTRVDAAREDGQGHQGVPDTSCALLLHRKTPPAAGGEVEEVEAKFQLRTGVERHHPVLLTGSIQEFVDCVLADRETPDAVADVRCVAGAVDEGTRSADGTSRRSTSWTSTRTASMSSPEGRRGVFGAAKGRPRGAALTSQPVGGRAVLDRRCKRDYPTKLSSWVILMDCWRGIRPLVVSGPTR